MQLDQRTESGNAKLGDKQLRASHVFQVLKISVHHRLELSPSRPEIREDHPLTVRIKAKGVPNSAAVSD